MGRVLRRFFRPLAKFAVFSWDRTDASKICGRIATSLVDGEHRRRDFLYPIWLSRAMPPSANEVPGSPSVTLVPRGGLAPRPSPNPVFDRRPITSRSLAPSHRDNSPREILEAGSGQVRNAQARNGSGERVSSRPVESLNVPHQTDNRRPDPRVAIFTIPRHPQRATRLKWPTAIDKAANNSAAMTEVATPRASG